MSEIKQKLEDINREIVELRSRRMTFFAIRATLTEKNQNVLLPSLQRRIEK